MPTEDDVFLVGLTWESLGVVAFRRQITLDLMGDFFGGPIVISWRKLHVFVEEDRCSLKRERKSPPNPAHIAHRDWR